MGIQRIATASSLPLTESERREYDKLFRMWTREGGPGAELLEPEQIERFAELSERIALSGQET